MDTVVGVNPSLEWLYQMRLGRAFRATKRLAASAGNLSHVQLRNGSGGTHSLALYAMRVSVEVATHVGLFTYPDPLVGGACVKANCLAGGPVGVGDVLFEQPAAPLGTEMLRAWASPTKPWVPWWPWLATVPDGQSVLVMAMSANRALHVVVEWVEYPL